MIGASLRIGMAIIPRVARVLPKIGRIARRLPVGKMRGAIKAMAKLGANALHKVKVLPKLAGRLIGKIKGGLRATILGGPKLRALEGELVNTGLKSKIVRLAKKVGSIALWFAPIPSVSTIKKAGGMIRKLGSKIKHIVRWPSKGVAKAINRIRKIGVVGGAKKLARRALKIARKHPVALGGIIGAGLLYRAMAHRRNKQNKRQSDVRDHLDPEKRDEGFFSRVVNKLKGILSKPAEVVEENVIEPVGRAVEGAGGLLLLIGLAFAFAKSRGR